MVSVIHYSVLLAIARFLCISNVGRVIYPVLYMRDFKNCEYHISSVVDVFKVSITQGEDLQDLINPLENAEEQNTRTME